MLSYAVRQHKFQKRSMRLINIPIEITLKDGGSMNLGGPATLDRQWEYADGLRFSGPDDPEFEERSISLYNVLLPLVSRWHGCSSSESCPDCQDVWHESFVDCIQNRSHCKVNFRAFCQWRVRNTWKQHRAKSSKHVYFEEIGNNSDSYQTIALIGEQDWLETVMGSMADRNLDQIETFSRTLLTHAKAHGAIDDRKWQVVWLQTFAGKKPEEIAEAVPGVNTPGNARVLAHRGWDDVTKHLIAQSFLLGWYSNLARANATRFQHEMHPVAEDSVRLLMDYLQETMVATGIEGKQTLAKRKMIRLGFLWVTSWLSNELPGGDKIWERVRGELISN